MTAIEFENIGKQYRLGLVSTQTLSHDLNRWWQTSVLGKEDPYLRIGEVNDRSTKGESEYVWALRDINFKVEQGDVVGIIGKNGAGKSTLLKLLSRVTTPTTGTIRARGRIASLLEVGTGFHPELTGRENIYMNGAIMGMTKQEIASKLDEIVDFSGCERYLDTPVKRYSSGMTVRLGFAVAAHLDPEILVVDEVLAVGDAEFQKKALGKMQSLSHGEGRTVLFVSHNMASVRQLCQNGILLERGLIRHFGNIEKIINMYIEDTLLSQSIHPISLVPISSNLKINAFTANSTNDHVIRVSPRKNTIDFHVEGMALCALKIALEARLFDNFGNLLGIHSLAHLNGYTPEYNGSFSIDETLLLPKNMTTGKFFLQIYLTHPNVEYLAKISEPLVIDSEGITGNSGITFEYSGAGFLML